MKVLGNMIVVLMLIALWLTVLAICLFSIYLMGSIALQFYVEYLIKVRLKWELIKKEIEKL